MKKISEMNYEELQARRKEIIEETKGDVIEQRMEEMNGELDEIEKRENALKERALTEKEIAERAGKQGNPINEFSKEKSMENQFNLDSKEFRSAYFKTLADEPLTEIEQRAYTHVSSTFGGAMPTTVVQEIWSLIEEEHALLGDITTYRTNTVLEITKHTAIVKGDAKTVNENAANDDEENKFIKVTLTGKDFSKHVELSYALSKMNGNALDAYLVNEIATRLGVAINAEVHAQVDKDISATNKVQTAAVGKISFADVAKLFGLLKGVKSRVVYVNNETLYNNLATLEDSSGQLIFQPSANEGINGYLLGAIVKVDDEVATGVIKVGDPKQIVGNFVQDIMLEQDKDIKRHVHIYSGYARFECVLVKPQAFAELTVKAA